MITESSVTASVSSSMIEVKVHVLHGIFAGHSGLGDGHAQEGAARGVRKVKGPLQGEGPAYSKLQGKEEESGQLEGTAADKDRRVLQTLREWWEQ